MDFYFISERSEVMGVTPISVLLLSLNKITFPGVPTLMSFKEVLTMFYEVRMLVSDITGLYVFNIL